MDLQFLEDTIFIQAISENDLVKNGSAFSSISNMIKNEVQKNYDPARPAASVLNILTPTLLSSFGFSWLAWLTRIAEWVFGVNFTGMYQSIIDAISGLIGTSNKITPEQSDQTVNNAVKEAFDSGTTNEGALDQFLNKTSSLKLDIRQAKLVILLSKQAGISSSLLSKYKDTTSGIFSKLLRWVVKVILSAAGFLAADIVVQKITGKEPNPKQKGLLPDSTPDTQVQLNLPPSKSVNFEQSNPSKFLEQHQNNKFNIWLEPNEAGSIKNQLILWAQEFYPILKNKESKISSLSSFNQILNIFLIQNKPDASLIIIPEVFTSLKDIIDRFAGDIQINK